MKIIVTVSLLVGFIALCLYLQVIVSEFGIRKSISDSNYFLKKPFKLMFELVMWICGLSIITTGIFLKDTPQWWIIGGGIGIFGVGIFSDFKRNLFLRISHYTSAISGFAMLGLSFWLNLNSFRYSAIIAVSALLAGLLGRKRIWCLELTMSIEVFIGLFYFALTLQ
nr:hypothetical protein [uncultured Carboxylicivirga sp.]